MPTLANDLVHFLMQLFGDREAVQEFLDNPERALADHGLGSVCSADVDAAMPVVLDYAPITVNASSFERNDGSGPWAASAGGAAGYGGYGVGSGAGAGDAEDHALAVQQLHYVVNHFSSSAGASIVDERATIAGQPPLQNVWAGGDAEQWFDSGVAASHDVHATAAGQVPVAADGGASQHAEDQDAGSQDMRSQDGQDAGSQDVWSRDIWDHDAWGPDAGGQETSGQETGGQETSGQAIGAGVAATTDSSLDGAGGLSGSVDSGSGADHDGSLAGEPAHPAQLPEPALVPAGSDLHGGAPVDIPGYATDVPAYGTDVPGFGTDAGDLHPDDPFHDPGSTGLAGGTHLDFADDAPAHPDADLDAHHIIDVPVVDDPPGL